MPVTFARAKSEYRLCKQELAYALNVSAKTIDLWTRSGKLVEGRDFICLISGRKRFHPDAGYRDEYPSTSATPE